MFTDLSKWIWLQEKAEPDTYAEFYDSFIFDGKKTKILISADSNYALYINGKYVYSGQYPDFPHFKVYDEIDITRYSKKGENKVAVVVWYHGTAHMSYYPGKAALRYEVYSDDRLCAYSSARTLSRKSRSFVNGEMKLITMQLGYGFHYDFTKEDDWKKGKLCCFENSIVVPQKLPLIVRPQKRCVIEKCRKATLIKNEDFLLYDIGGEEAGFLSFSISSQTEQTITISYGDHIADGRVRRIIGGRDFSVRMTLKKGENEIMYPLRRLGGRYLEITAEEPIVVNYIGLCPVNYPLKHKKRRFDSPLRQKIYDVSVRTLLLCMHDHYEDTPWREQGLYTMDSRNQILCGYYAFGERDFARACLKLFSVDNRKDTLVSICVPTSLDLVIPSFSLVYFTEIYEYLKYTGDKTLGYEVYPKLLAILNTFISRMENGLVPTFPGKNNWNFYEWSEGLEGTCCVAQKKDVDAALNCMLVLALENMQKISKILGKDVDYKAAINSLRRNIHKTFYDEKSGLYKNSVRDNRKSELVNALCVLCRAAKGDVARKICAVLADDDNDLTRITLSMACFKYDALLLTDKGYKDYILSDIDRKYKIMLDAGATSFWETEKGESDFDGAGSLCHGWSAMPVYYYCKLK